MKNIIKRPSFDDYFLMIATVVGMRSTCARRQVGCVITDRHNVIIGTGYNGIARGLPHCIDNSCPGANLKSGTGLDLCEAIHAEQNALINCDKHLEIYNLYCTHSPCIHCTKLLMNTPTQRIVFIEDYSNNGKLLWSKTGRLWIKLPDPLKRWKLNYE